MPTSFLDSRNRLLQATLDFLWRQWSSLGVAGQTGPADDRIIDPEALLLLTTRLGRYDPRLMDEVIDWLSQNGKRLNLQRLRRLHGLWAVADTRVLASISAILAEQSALRKWKLLASTAIPASEPEPLFLSPDGDPQPIFSLPDPHFLQNGLRRAPFRPRGMSQTPDPRKAGNFLCTLRALFGVNARADIIAWLLSHESGHPAAIARDTSYYVKTIQQTLNDMEDSGQIRSRRHGREKIFWLRQDDWSFLKTWSSPASFPRYFDWMPLFHGLRLILEAEIPGTENSSSASLKSMALRELLIVSYPSLERAGLAPLLHTQRSMTGSDLTQSILQDFVAIGHFLSPASSGIQTDT